MKKEKYRVLSPDGLDTSFNGDYKTLEQAEEEAKRFASSYEHQGYYSTIRDGERYRMPINEIVSNCLIIKS
jgi:hypothetical protein